MPSETTGCSTSSTTRPDGRSISIRKDRPFSEQEFERRRLLALLGVEVFMASAEDTIIAKLEWSKLSGGSERQRRDIAGMLATVGDDLDRGYIERWLNELDLTVEWLIAKQTQVS